MPVTRKSSYSVYSQACSVCKEEFFGRSDWLNHLPGQDHQKLAREECLKIWNSDLRKSCLIIFTSESLTSCNALGILEHFSSSINNADCVAMVTDFIWWEDRPKIGILQFESREKAKQMLKTSGCRNSQKVQIGDFHWVQAKIGAKLFELEWDAIRPPVELNVNEISPNKKRKLDENVSPQTSGPTPNPVIRPLSTANSVKSPPFPITATSHPLQFDYLSIQNTVLVPRIPTTNSPMEKQVCRLLEYLCQFDPRCKPLINLATYWVTLNSINISGEGDPKSSTELPPHHTIQWLVMFYFCYKRYIPTPREILKKTSRNVSEDGITDTNIDFQCDPAYVEEWKLQKGNSLHSMDKLSDEFVLNIIKLFRDFLSHSVGTCGGKEVEKVINTHDGKSISVSALLNTNYSNMHKSRRSSRWQKLMSLEEVDMLKTAVLQIKSSNKFFGLYMTNPFLFSQNISLAKDIKISLKHFSTESVKIGLFLSQVKKIGVEASLEEVGGLKNLLTVANKN